MTHHSMTKALGVAATLSFAMLSVACGHHTQAKGDANGDLAVKDEFRQTYQLSPGARVEVSGINGSVEVKTANTNQADVQIVRSAETQEDLAYARIKVEHTPTGLVIKGERVDKDLSGKLYRSLFGGGRGSVRQRVVLLVPRQIELAASGVNGRVNIGEVDGEVRVDGVNGRVDVLQSVGATRISGVNGNIEATLARLGARGVSVDGVNGNVQLRFRDAVNAELDVSGINGRVAAKLPGLQPPSKDTPHNFRAVIGKGGAPIKISGMNGNLTLVPDAAPSAAVAPSPEASPKASE
jgi:hypothetical protein